MTTFGKLKRFDQSEIWEVHRSYFIESGLSPWQLGYLPHSGVTNYEEAFKKASFFITNLKFLEEQGESFESITVLEIGSGSGHFARNFMKAFELISKERGLGYFEKLVCDLK